MRNRRLVQTAILAVAIVVACLGASVGTARASVITLDVSASLYAYLPPSVCVFPGCSLGGTLVFDNVTGNISSVDITMSGESPAVGPFNSSPGVKPFLGATDLTVFSFVRGDSAELTLTFNTPTLGSLAGYNGGPLPGGAVVPNDGGAWEIIQPGSLTPAPTPTPEPASLLLFGTGLLGAGALLKRRMRTA